MLSRSAMLEFIGQYLLGTEYSNSTWRNLAERYIQGGCYLRNYEANMRIDTVFTVNERNQDLRERILTKRDRSFLVSARKNELMRDKLEPKCTLDNSELRLAISRFEPLLHPEVSPLFTETFDRVPPTYIVSCGSDVLRDDALLYVERLKDAQTLVEHKHYLDKYHMVLFFETSKVVDDLRQFLHRNALL